MCRLNNWHYAEANISTPLNKSLICLTKLFFVSKDMRLCLSKYMLFFSLVNRLWMCRNGRSGVMFINVECCPATVASEWRVWCPWCCQTTSLTRWSPWQPVYPSASLTRRSRPGSTNISQWVCFSSDLPVFAMYIYIMSSKGENVHNYLSWYWKQCQAFSFMASCISSLDYWF